VSSIAIISWSIFVANRAGEDFLASQIDVAPVSSTARAPHRLVAAASRQLVSLRSEYKGMTARAARTNPGRGSRACTRPLSRLLYISIYAIVARGSQLDAPILDVALQPVVQGILTAIVALLLHGRMAGLLGATAGAAFVALTPATTALSACWCSANGLLRSTGSLSH
jgi:hypothetical protein